MDRNTITLDNGAEFAKSPPARVAWIETWVSCTAPPAHQRSPPARVAWIETFLRIALCGGLGVATREGGVDRNNSSMEARTAEKQSPPARVAWIETLRQELPERQIQRVATREGGVDRNAQHISAFEASDCRHPRGWRG